MRVFLSLFFPLSLSLATKTRKKEKTREKKTHPTNAPHQATFLPAAWLNAASSLSAAPAYALIVGSPRGVSASMAKTGERVVPSKRLMSREAARYRASTKAK